MTRKGIKSVSLPYKIDIVSNTSKKIALLKKVAAIPILAGLIYFFCIEIIAQEKPKAINLETDKTIPTDKDKIRDAYYSGVYVKICDEKTNRKSNGGALFH